MMSVAQDWQEGRRKFILQLLVRVGSANATMICTALEHGGFARDPRSAFRADLDHLRDIGCLTETWADDVRVLTITERGEDAARGRVEVPGVSTARWSPPG